MKRRWPKIKMPPGEENLPLGYGGGYPRLPGEWPPRRLRGPQSFLLRLAAAFLLLALMLWLVNLAGPVGERARQNLRSVLAADWNLRPALERAVQWGLAQVNADHNWNNELMPAVKPLPVAVGENSRQQVELPLAGRISRGFGFYLDPRDNLERYHAGVDIVAEPGAIVRAVKNGRVLRVYEEAPLGRCLLIDHGQDETALYGCLQEVFVAAGAKVEKGQAIGRTGESGEAGRGGVHFELRRKGRLLDPLTVLPQEAVGERGDRSASDAGGRN